ncbi:MAG: 2-phospho-L-lactate transferase [Promethearchaeota archaeon]
MKLVVLSGGTGTPKLIEGLLHIEEQFMVVANTGDDWNFYGLHVSPDVDSVLFTLAGIIDPDKFWGIKGDTKFLVRGLKKFLGERVWFNLGDADTAISLFRTYLLKEGLKLSETTQEIARRLKIKQQVYPMAEDPVSTIVLTENGSMHLEEFWVREKGKPKVHDIKLQGIESARVPKEIVDEIINADRVLIGPSNPISSIGPIIALPPIREALRKTSAYRIAISPFIGVAPVSGPAGVFMHALGKETSFLGILELYHDILDAMVIDRKDEQSMKHSDSGVEVLSTNIVMKTLSDKICLAQEVTKHVPADQS